jgi:hypothetical protein
MIHDVRVPFDLLRLWPALDRPERAVSLVRAIADPVRQAWGRKI